jgi:RNA polymerase sigma-70 factor (ECF subfamily)
MADDVTQKVFIKLARKPEAWRPTASFSSWLHRVARNAALDALKSGPKRASLDEMDTVRPAVPVTRETPDRGESSDRMRSLVFEAIQRLEGPQREALVLREYSELSYREICDVTGRSLANVKQDIHQARQFLRTELTPHLERTGIR